MAQQALFDELLASTILPGLSGAASADQEKTTVQLVGAVARHSPQKVGPMLLDIVPRILKAAAKEDDELREAVLQVHFYMDPLAVESVSQAYRPSSRLF